MVRTGAQAASVPARLAFHYASLFLVLGIYGPYWPIWLAERGLSPDVIGLVLASGIFAKLIVGPRVAAFADKRGVRRAPLIIVSVTSLLAFALFDIADGALSLTLVSLLFFACWGPSLPLTESLTLLAREAKDFDYGRVRLWGSISFMVGNVVIGYLIEGSGAGMVYGAVLAALVLSILSALTLPSFPIERAMPESRPFREVARIPGLVLLMVAAALIQASHALYYGFSTIHWTSLGIPEGTIGLLWAEGVLVEVVLFAFSALVVRRIGAENLIILGGLAAALRWGLTGVAESLETLILLQVLHALSFGATHLGIINVIAARAPDRISASAQSLNALILGGAMALSSVSAGFIYGDVGGVAFWGMAVLASMGFAIAIRARVTT